MANEDLTRLRINRTDGAGHRARRWRLPLILLLVAAAGAAGFFYRQSHAPIPVEVAVITQAYPSQAHTQLNATGYVVAQRKAAVASKATGRLEWLGVREGSTVRAGEVLCIPSWMEHSAEEIGRAHV